MANKHHKPEEIVAKLDTRKIPIEFACDVIPLGIGLKGGFDASAGSFWSFTTLRAPE